jgi:hypothetical protein
MGPVAASLPPAPTTAQGLCPPPTPLTPLPTLHHHPPTHPPTQRAPYGFFDRFYERKQDALKLYVRRVFISDEIEELLPK